jgi:hypothetical protein
MPQRRGVKDEGLLAQAPTHHGHAELARLVEEVRQGRFQRAMQILQEHSGQEAPLLRDLYHETLEGLISSQGVRSMRTKAGDTFFNVFGQEAREERARVTSAYLTTLGVQREQEGEACMVDVEESRRLLGPTAIKEGGPSVELVHLRADSQTPPLCHTQHSFPHVMRQVPYVTWRQAVMRPSVKPGDHASCQTCLARAKDVDVPRAPEATAWLDERRERAAQEEIRDRTDVALRERLRSRAPIKEATGRNLAAKQYKHGVLAQAARALRLDQGAFEELCFMPEQRERRVSLQATIGQPLPEVLSEDEWLELLVEKIPASMEMALNTGTLHHHYGDAALSRIEAKLSTQQAAPSVVIP